MKEKIYGIKNIEDNVWFNLDATVHSMGHLSDVFNLREIIKSYNMNDVPVDFFSYKEWLKYSPYFVVQEENVLAYFVLNEEMVHLILRKIGKWQNLREDIMKRFEFVDVRK